jgi:hypothetical protein
MLTPKVQVNNIDFNTLTKGDKIKVNVIEERYGIKQDQAIYALALTMLRQEIEKSLKAREYPVTTKGVDGNIHILTDAEATYELHSRTTKRLKGIGRDHNQMQNVDKTNLTQEQQNLHHRRIDVQSRTIQAVKSVRPKIQFEVYKKI